MFSLSPSVDIREFDLTLSIPNLPSSKTGAVIRANWGEALKIVPVTSERDLTNSFKTPTNYNYQDWFNCWNFLQYAGSLYPVRAIDTTAENAGIAFTVGTKVVGAAQIEEADLYNSDRAELTLQGMAIADSLKFFNRYVSSYQPFAVGVCMTADNWNRPFCAEGIRFIDGTFDSTTGDTTTDITFVENTLVAGDKFVFADTTRTVLAVDSTAMIVSISPAILDGTAGTSGSVFATSIVTAADKAANALVFSNNVLTSAGSVVPMSALFDYQPDWAKGEFAIAVFELDEDGKYDVAGSGTELYIVSKKSTGRDNQGRNNFVEEVFYKSSKSLYAKIDADTTAIFDTAFSPLAAIVGTDLTDQAAGKYLYPRTAVYDGTVFSTWQYDPAGYKKADVQNAFAQFADPEQFDINILIAHQLDLNNASTISESRKDCWTVVAPYDYLSLVGKSATEATDWLVNSFAGAQAADPGSLQFNTFGSYSSVYGNMKYQYDKFNDVNRWLCVAGDIAGLAAQTDSNRDPWWAIAGLDRGKIKNAIKVAVNPNKANRDVLYPNAINPIYSIAGEGVAIVMGQKTAVARPSAFDRVNVRRLLITIEKAIATASRYALFEFNDEFTRARLRGLIEPFLRDVKGRRGIYDFEVVIDDSNNTGEIIDKNALVIDVYIKPARVAEFIQVNMRVTRTDANFAESIGR